jgi:hypothetical protein
MTDAAMQPANRWADLWDSEDDDVVPTHDDVTPRAGAKPPADAALAALPEEANAGADADGFQPVRVGKPRMSAHQRADAHRRACIVRLLKRVARAKDPDGNCLFLCWKDYIATFPRHIGRPLPNQMPARTLEELKAVVEALVDDGILKRRKRYALGSCAFTARP